MHLTTSPIDAAKHFRNVRWNSHKAIPKWVDPEKVDLDQFFTKPEVAEQCYRQFCDFLQSRGEDVSTFTHIEPSAGQGAFYRLMPENRRIGVDVDTKSAEFVRADFLSWEPPLTSHPVVCVGNPPFGYRAWLALAFINHAAQFSKYVAFIVPMAFQSKGKGSPRGRVKGMRLVHSEHLAADSFTDPAGRTVRVNCLWQIWEKVDSHEQEPEPTCNDYIDLFTVDKRKERLCGQTRLHEASFFIQRTYFGKPPGLVTDFNDVKYGCGYGIVIKKQKKQVIAALQSADWVKHSNLASHNCRHISMSHIRDVLIEKGLCDA